MNRLILSLFVLVLLSTSCAVMVDDGSSKSRDAQLNSVQFRTLPEEQRSPEQQFPLPEIVLPISVYIIDDVDGDYSSARTEDEIREIYTKANEIWSQANISLDVEQVVRVEVPHDTAQGLATGQYRPFFQQVGREFDLPRSSLMYAFYTKAIGGPNGIAPLGSRSFFVMDTPSVHDERVTSHEVGHILALHHTLEDDGRLMYPGTNGMTLTEEEIVVARYAAAGLLAGLR